MKDLRQGPPIDWKALAESSGITPSTGASSAHGLRGLELILGEDNCRRAVDEYIAGGPAAEFVRQVLIIARPWTSMEQCLRVIAEDASERQRSSAAELLRSIGDRRVVGSLQELLNDRNEQVRYWATALLGTLLSSGQFTKDEALPYMQAIGRTGSKRQRQLAASTCMRFFASEEIARHGLPSLGSVD